jgi:hypothetical protein
MPDFIVEVQAVTGIEPPEIGTVAPAVEVVVSPAVIAEGAGTDKYNVHTQNDPSAVWEYEHGLGKNPAVTCVSSDRAIREGDVTYPENNVSVRIEHSGAMSGYAYNS